MVVIAVAGILMALVLPALSKAKEKSRRTVCCENIRQDIMALTIYSDVNDNFLPSAVDDAGNYHSIVIPHLTFTDLVQDGLEGVSNTLYCPNLVYATGTMGSESAAGYTIDYSYLAQAPIKLTNPKGPDPSWGGPDKNDLRSEVLADANYWSQTPALAMTYVPHGASGGLLASVTKAGTVNNFVNNASTPVAGPTPGSASANYGAAGGNVGFLSGTVLWRSLRSMNQYSASSDGTASGNW